MYSAICFSRCHTHTSPCHSMFLCSVPHPSRVGCRREAVPSSLVLSCRSFWLYPASADKVTMTFAHIFQCGGLVLHSKGTCLFLIPCFIPGPRSVLGAGYDELSICWPTSLLFLESPESFWSKYLSASFSSFFFSSPLSLSHLLLPSLFLQLLFTSLAP